MIARRGGCVLLDRRVLLTVSLAFLGRGTARAADDVGREAIAAVPSALMWFVDSWAVMCVLSTRCSRPFLGSCISAG